MIISYLLLTLSLLTLPQTENPDLLRGETTKVYISPQSHSNESISIRSLTNHQRFKDWTDQEDLEAFSQIQKVAALWKKQGQFDSLLIAGKTSPNLRSEIFEWELVPFHSNQWNEWKRLKLIWNNSFGNALLTEEEQIEQCARMRSTLEETTSEINFASKTELPDPFCEKAVIERQTILETPHMLLLYDLYPGKAIEELPHFLIITKAHKESISELTADEYVEAMQLVRKIVNYSQEEWPTSTLFLLNKSGAPAGQTVGHWHLHVIVNKDDATLPSFQFPCNKTPTSCTRLSSPFLKVQKMCGSFWQGCKNLLFILFPHGRLSDEELQERVDYYRKELQP